MTRNEKKLRRRTRLLFATVSIAALLLVSRHLCQPRVAAADLSVSAQRVEEQRFVPEVVAAEPVVFEPTERIVAFGSFVDCELTYYCCEKHKHICGTGTGLTASGKPVAPGMCAADDIPLGATVMIDYDGDGYIDEYLVCEDRFGSGQANHLDIAVPTHDEALSLGVSTAAYVSWVLAEEVEGDA